MNALHGTIKNGQIVWDMHPAFPDGTRVEVLPIDSETSTGGMLEEQWPTTPEGIAAHLAHMDEVEPGWLSPADEESWRTAIREQREREKG